MKLTKTNVFTGRGQLALGLLGAMLSTALPSMAADGTWTAVGTNLDWWNPANWQNGAVGEGAGATVSISGAGDTSINLTNAVSIKNIAVSGSGTKMIAGTGSIVLADAAGGNGVASFNSGSILHVDVPVSGNMNIRKSGGGAVYLNARCTTTGKLQIEGGTFGSDWSHVADSPSPTTGDNNVTRDILPVTDVSVTGTAAVNFNPRVTRATDQTFTVALSADSRAVTFASTASISAGQRVEADGGLLADGTFVSRVVDGTTVELSAKPLATTASATLRVKAAPQFCSLQSFKSLDVSPYGGLSLGLNEGFRLYLTKLSGAGNISLERPGLMMVEDTISYLGTVSLGHAARLYCATANPMSDGLPVADGLVFRMDASDASTLALAGDEVTSWRTVDGAGDITATPAGSTRPVLLRNALNGLPVVDMGPAVDDGGMAWSAPVGNIRTFFVVLGSQAGGGTVLGANGALEGYCFSRGGDAMASKGIQNTITYTYPLTRDHVVFRHNSQQKPEREDLQYFLNGSQANFLSTLSGDYDLVSGCLSQGDAAASAFARVADGTSTRTGSEGGQRLAEVILYSRVLTVHERQAVEAYLRRKWFGETPRGWGCGYIESLVDNKDEFTRPPVEGGAGGRVRVGTLAQTSAATYMTLENGTVEIDRADFKKQLRLMSNGHIEFTARQTSANCPVSGAALHVDATRNVETDGSGRVLFWGGVDGAGYACTNRHGLGAAPTLLANGLNGKPVVDFGAASSTQHLVWHTNINVRALFFVMKASNRQVTFCGSVCPEMNVVDHFTRYCNDLDGFIYDKVVQLGARGGIARLDGHRIPNPHQYVLSTNEFKLLGHTLDCSAMANAFGCGALQQGNLRAVRTGGLQIAEALIFDRKLTDEESLAIQAYLRYKWFGETLTGFSAPGEPFAVPGIGAGGANASVTIRGTAPVSVGTMFGGQNVTLSAPDGALVAIPNLQSPLVISNASVAASGNLGRGVIVNAGSTNTLVSSGGTFSGALVSGTLKVPGDTGADITTLTLYGGSGLLLAPDSDACTGIAACTLDVQGGGTVHLEIPASRIAQPEGRYAFVSASSTFSAASQANLSGWTVTSNLNPRKWNVRLHVTDTGAAVVVSPQGCVIVFR